MSALVKVQAVAVSRGGAAILRDVSFSLAAGATLVVLGATGAGKTSLLRTLALLDTPEHGSIEIAGYQYRSRPPEPSRQRPWPRVTMVLQELALWPHLTVRENVLLPLRSAARGRQQRRLSVVSSALAIEKLLDRRPWQLSGGQRQLVALARAFALEPSVVLLDEPTAALDADMVQRLSELLADFKGQGGTVVFTTHLIGFARSAADEFVFLDGGKVAEAGHIHLLDTPRTVSLARFMAVAAVRGSTSGE